MRVYSLPRRVFLAQPGLWLHGKHIERVNTYKYLGLLMDYPISWRPAEQQTIAYCRHLLAVLDWMYGPTWGHFPS